MLTIRREDERLGQHKHKLSIYTNAFPISFQNKVQCENCNVTLCSILWHKISFYTVQVRALDWGFLAWNMFSVICQRNVLPRWTGSESSPPGVSRAVSEVQQSMMWTVSEECGDFVVAVDWWGLFREKHRGGWEEERKTLRQEKEGEEVKAGNGFSNLKGISCYIQDVLCGRMGRTRWNVSVKLGR